MAADVMTAAIPPPMAPFIVTTAVRLAIFHRPERKERTVQKICVILKDLNLYRNTPIKRPFEYGPSLET